MVLKSIKRSAEVWTKAKSQHMVAEVMMRMLEEEEEDGSVL